MDAQRFDRFTKAWSRGRDRRTVFRLLVGVLGGVGAAWRSPPVGAIGVCGLNDECRQCVQIPGTEQCNCQIFEGSCFQDLLTADERLCHAESGVCENGFCRHERIADGTECGDGGTCLQGSCCQDPNEICAGICTATEFARIHCGGCGIACDPSQDCCGGVCLDTRNDDDHCGQRCEVCGNNQKCCASFCRDIKTDRRHCGACGVTCESDHDCCAGACVSWASDPDHCGGCGNACAAGRSCCGGQCVDTNTDSRACGGCTPCTGSPYAPEVPEVPEVPDVRRAPAGRLIRRHDWDRS